MTLDRSGWFTSSIPSLLVIVFGAFILLLAAAEEPYHIDELRQTRHYDKSFSRVIEESRGQEQPPLDPLLNAAAYRVLGQGDIRQRILSVAFGVGSLVLMWRLTARAGLSSAGSAFAVGVMAVTPALINVTAYARPYALPLFLMLAFLLTADIWIRSGRKRCPLLLGAVAVALPWSRTVEPVIFLVLAVVASGFLAWRTRDLRRRALVVTAVGVLGLISSVLALAFVSEQIEDRTPTGASSLIDRLGRLFTEVPATVGEALPYWPALLLLAVIALALPASRRLLGSMWWWWVLLGTGIGFALAFSLVAPVGQRFYDRYVFTMVPPLAVVPGVAVTLPQKLHRTRFNSALRVGVVTLSILVLGVGAATTWLDLTRASRADWEAASSVLNEDVPHDVVVIYDAVTFLGDYRTPFAGYPRYTGNRSPIPLTLQIIKNPSVISAGSNSAVLLLTRSDFEVRGWTPVSIDRFFTLYLPDTPREGREGAARSAEEFGEALGPRLGSAMTLAAASIWLDIGERERASELVNSLLVAETAPSVMAVIESTDLRSLAHESSP